MTRSELIARFPKASESFLAANSTLEAPQRARRRDLKSITLSEHTNHAYNQINAAIPHPEPKSNHAPALVNSATREEERLGRVIVRFTGYRVRLLDVDSYPASIKGLLDGLCKIGLIQSDQPKHVILQTDQVKVASYAEEKTTIELTYPEPV